MNTLLLDQTAWDLVTDINNDIAVASDPYSQAQDAASEIKLFQGELWYDTTRGIPYFTSVLGQRPPLALLKARFADAAMLVPGVAAAQTFISGLTARALSGQVQIKNSSGQQSVSTF